MKIIFSRYRPRSFVEAWTVWAFSESQQVNRVTEVIDHIVHCICIQFRSVNGRSFVSYSRRLLRRVSRLVREEGRCWLRSTRWCSDSVDRRSDVRSVSSSTRRSAHLIHHSKLCYIHISSADALLYTSNWILANDRTTKDGSSRVIIWQCTLSIDHVCPPRNSKGLSYESLQVTPNRVMRSKQWWANPNRDWDLNRDLSVLGEWFDKWFDNLTWFWDWFGMRDWDLIRFGILGDSIRSVGFDSRILASCRYSLSVFSVCLLLFWVS